MWALLILFAGLAWAQSPPAPVFPDDTQDPKTAGGAELLETVCPGHVLVGVKIRCNNGCPEEAGLSDLNSWELQHVTFGHFLQPTSDKTPHKGISFAPATNPYRIDFTFAGKTFKRTTKP